MNSFSLEYTDDAEDMLAEAWLAAKNRQTATAAQNQIDLLLSRDPTHAGEELSEELWRILVPPLVAYYEIDEQKSKVTVTGFALLRAFGKKGDWTSATPPKPGKSLNRKGPVPFFSERS